MNARLKGIAIWCAGWLFILVGIAGLFLPILQGVLFILIGLFLLSKQSPWAARLLHKLRKRFPSVARLSDEAMARAARVQARLFTRKKRPAEDVEP